MHHALLRGGRCWLAIYLVDIMTDSNIGLESNHCLFHYRHHRVVKCRGSVRTNIKM